MSKDYAPVGHHHRSRPARASGPLGAHQRQWRDEQETFTVGPEATFEEAAQNMPENQIGGLPVIDDKNLVGITASDVLDAFLDLMGTSKGGSTRINFILEGEEHGMVDATRLVAREGGEVLGVGTYSGKLGDNSICYLRLISGNAEKIAKALRARGFDVLRVHRIGAGTQ